MESYYKSRQNIKESLNRVVNFGIKKGIMKNILKRRVRVQNFLNIEFLLGHIKKKNILVFTTF